MSGKSCKSLYIILKNIIFVNYLYKIKNLYEINLYEYFRVNFNYKFNWNYNIKKNINGLWKFYLVSRITTN